MAGVTRQQYTPEIKIIRLTCTGRIDLSFILHAFLQGADGVFIGGCWLGECHYITEGNYDALATVLLGKKLLQKMGIEPERLRIEWIAASEGSRFAEVINDFVKTLEELGSLGRRVGVEGESLKSKLEVANKLVPYIKLVERERLRAPVKTEKAYNDFYQSDETNKLFDELIGSKLLIGQIISLLEKGPLSTEQIAERLSINPSDVSKVMNSSSRQGFVTYDLEHKCYAGIPKSKKQAEGQSGGCIPEKRLDLKVDFDELTATGSMMGPGGLIVIDEKTCMVDVARYFIHFLAEKSCGKCLPCREGLRQMHNILVAITEGKGKEDHIETLKELSEVVQETSLCALGRTAPNPFLSTFRYFKDEYEAHIKDKRCPALSCKALITYYIDPQKCSACMLCLKRCPDDAIDGGKEKIHIIDQDKCTRCGTCFDICPSRFGAVKKLSGEPIPEPIPEEKRLCVKKKKNG